MEDYWDILEINSKVFSEATHRKIACTFSRLLWNELDELGRNALIAAEDYSMGKETIETCADYQKQLQKFLPGDGKSIPYSAVIWALQMPTDSYPMWYCAAIVGVNIIDLKAATNKELCAIVKKITGDPLNHAETGA